MYQPTSDVGRQLIFGYTRSIKNCDRSILDLFSDITIIHDNKIYPVPIVWGSQEKAVIYVFGENFINNEERKEEGLVDRITLPVLALHGTDIEFDASRFIYHEARDYRAGAGDSGLFNQEKRPFDTRFGISKGIPINRNYTLYVWAKYYENLMQIVEQIYLKFSPIAYIRFEGNRWETPVKLTGSASNITEDVGDRQTRILKYSFNLLAESHIQQPIKRDKTVLKIVQKYVVEGDLSVNSEIDTIIEEVEEGETPETINRGEN
jgi:hypothetical protein